MNIFNKAIRRRRNRSDYDVDLLSATFGLPFLRGNGSGNTSARRIAIDCVSESESDSECGDGSEVGSEGVSSLSSEDDRGGREQRGYDTPERVSMSRPLPHSSPHPSKRSPKRKKHHRRHLAKSSPRSSTRKSSRRRGSRSSSRRSTAEIMNSQQQPVSHVTPSATFPPQFPLPLSKQQCNIVQSSSFPIPSLSQPLRVPVCQPFPQQPVYYHHQINYVPHQPSPLMQVHPAQYIAPIAQPAAARAPVSDQAPAISMPPAGFRNILNSAGDGSNRYQKPGNQGDTKASGPLTNEVQRLQKHIEAKMADLAEEPNSRILRRDLRRLQDRLNLALNKAITASRKSHARQVSLSTFSSFSQPAPDSHKTAQEKDFQQSRKREQCGQRDVSPQRIERHHVCTECGNTRSALYHKRFPVGPGPSTKINLCESCREMEYKRGVIRQYHFCSNCGSARSKAFHAQHPVFPGEPIFTNYCDACVLEFHYNGSLPDDSVIGLAPRLKDHIARRAAIKKEDDMDSLTVNRHRNRKKGERNVSIDQNEATEYEKVASTVEKVRGRCPEPREARGTVISPESSYCPLRNTGSSGRRAERKSSRETNTDPPPPPQKESEKRPRNYQAPYVEDSVSTAHSKGDMHINSHEGEMAGQKSANKVYEPWKTLPHDFVLKSAMASDRSSSDGSGKIRNATEKEPCRQRGKSLDSERSDPSSSKSCGSKTVRFKKSVDVRTPFTYEGNTEFSEPESPTRMRLPGSPLISRQKPSYYNSYSPERKATDKYLHPHYGQTSRNSSVPKHENLRTPDDFQPGAPSKGYSQGAFSKDFDNGADWDSFRSPAYSCVEQYADDSPLPERHETDEGFQAPIPKFHDYSYHDQCMESTASLPSRTSSGSVFSSFFKKKKNKSSSVPPGVRAGSYPPSHNFNETARDN
ncbi:hypothetical protein FVEG_00892 [Fusarium verticillioides 7600]|uniref:Uncharacterized protein n=1 Tax=Gibberella moniliformis (strain M3125 / FGSC 7600) TaxID=334819 RepID=W7LC96_GIBM7|nr:hypothetical protein FVEG_00892 [Fusarium verticillioides 7600]EWG37148.1 hypothetical protein FVEG_00892 [Fusarium verticillioides 7600]RBR01691.1 hypothetical protein FVER53263_00892 [Fusarium verticillioides]